MRLWSIHPKYLDQKGICGLWREALLAQSVLNGKTKGYKKHPQLDRFKNTNDSVGAIGYYLDMIYSEAKKRGYNFNPDLIVRVNPVILRVTNSQLEYEMKHLQNKLKDRGRKKWIENITINVLPHPMFRKVKGEIEPWEKF